MSRSRVICVLRDEPFLSLPTSLNSPRSFLQNGAENGPREEIEKQSRKAIFDNRRDISQEENDGFEPGREKSRGSGISVEIMRIADQNKGEERKIKRISARTGEGAGAGNLASIFAMTDLSTAQPGKLTFGMQDKERARKK